MQLLNRAFRRHTDSTNEQRSLLVNNDVQKLRQLSLRIVVLEFRKSVSYVAAKIR